MENDLEELKAHIRGMSDSARVETVVAAADAVESLNHADGIMIASVILFKAMEGRDAAECLQLLAALTSFVIEAWDRAAREAAEALKKAPAAGHA